METRGIPGHWVGTSDEGLTLIELLVVIIIIGILAAIAIPVFFNQREKAFNAAMKSDIHTLAQFEEAYLIDSGSGSGSYATVAQLQVDYDPRASENVTVTVMIDGGLGYCLAGRHPGSSTTWFYDSQAGGLQDKGSVGCPVTSGGTPGGVVVG